jgi:guanylate kinase
MKGLLVIISAPSGVGKTTIIRRILDQDEGCTFAISHTTRPPRTGETDGRDYYFVDDDAFQAILDSRGFAEWAHVHEHRYGTSMAEIDRLTGTGQDAVFEVDFQGGRSLMRRFPEAVSIFIVPPSMAEVRKRLETRGTDSTDTVNLRLHNARIEIATAGEYRYLVVNDDLERAVVDVQAIIRAERLRSIRYPDRIRTLVAEDV